MRGSALSLLLGLLALGAVLYFLLRPGGHGSAATGAGGALDCQPRIAQLVRDTGGVGSAAQAAYEALPPECRRLMPAPASLAPSPERAPDT